MAAGAVSWDGYATAWAGLHGGLDPREARPSVRGWLRLGYLLAYAADRVRVKPGTVTALGLLACLAVPALARHGAAGAACGALLVVFAAIADTVDGALAVLASRATRLGYVYDSVADRLAEACWLVALWLVGGSPAVAVTAGGLSYLHEYARSRANAAGMTEISAVTLGERPTRVLLTVIGLVSAAAVGPFNPALPAGVATFVTAVWVVFALIGLAQLFVAVHRALAGREWPTWKPPAPSPAPTVDDDTRGRTTPGTGDGPSPVDADLLAELEKLERLPAGTTVYTSGSALAEGAGSDTGRAAGERPSGGPHRAGGPNRAGERPPAGAPGRHRATGTSGNRRPGRTPRPGRGTAGAAHAAGGRRSAGTLGQAEDGERAVVAGELEVPQHVDETEPPVEPPRP